MDTKITGVQTCPACGNRLSRRGRPPVPCSRCALVAELIEELIRKQIPVWTAAARGTLCL
jgi:hypothetical protein